MTDGSELTADGGWDLGHGFADRLDVDTHVGAALQAENSDVSPRVLNLGRVSVLQGSCDEGLEPTLSY